MASRRLRRTGTRSVLEPTLALLMAIATLSAGYWVVESLAADASNWEAGAAALFDAGGNEPYHVWHEGHVWRLVTAVFLHADAFHLGTNMLWLTLLVTLLSRLGVATGRESVVVALLTAVVGQLASALVSPAMSVGASGGVYGLLGFSVARGGLIGHPTLSVWQRWSLLLIGMLSLVMVLQTPDDPAVDRAAHVGGLMSGLALGWAAWVRHSAVAIAVCATLLFATLAQVTWVYATSPLDATWMRDPRNGLPVPVFPQQGWLSQDGRCVVGPQALPTPTRCSLFPLRAAAISGPVADIRRANVDVAAHLPSGDACVETQVRPGTRAERLLVVRQGTQVLILMAREPTWTRLKDVRREVKRVRCPDK